MGFNDDDGIIETLVKICKGRSSHWIVKKSAGTLEGRKCRQINSIGIKIKLQFNRKIIIVKINAAVEHMFKAVLTCISVFGSDRFVLVLHWQKKNILVLWHLNWDKNKHQHTATWRKVWPLTFTHHFLLSLWKWSISEGEREPHTRLVHRLHSSPQLALILTPVLWLYVSVAINQTGSSQFLKEQASGINNQNIKGKWEQRTELNK